MEINRKTTLRSELGPDSLGTADDSGDLRLRRKRFGYTGRHLDGPVAGRNLAERLVSEVSGIVVVVRPDPCVGGNACPDGAPQQFVDADPMGSRREIPKGDVDPRRSCGQNRPARIEAGSFE